ncbi:MAG: FAD-binding monooxygenase [Podila humilis]|nr:MAG: FAD-binding monooxygenase [Podila humilis]
MSSTTKASSHSPLNVPVLISGAGPTGLFAAILLTKLGHPCRIIERHFEISPLSKALVIHARTMEMFAFSGIIDSFISQGVHLTDLHVYIGGKLTSVIPTLRSTESEYTYGLFLEQLRTTAILTEELEKLGGHVDRGWELLDTKVVQDPETGKEHVETVIRRAIVGTNTRATESTILGVVEEDRDEEGKEYEVQTVRSQYLIATDGGKSVVRHKVDIGFPGKTLDNNIILIDCLVDSPISLKSITIVAAGDNHRAMAVFPVRGDVIRIILDSGVLTPEEHAKLDSKELTLEMCQKLVDECASPTQFRLHDPTWVTYYRVNERLAERFSFKNRIFLAGDAAHVHSPVGGQGMNTGLQDSYNLTWKLGLVLDGLAPESILETYDVERKPVAADIINLSSRGLDFGLAQDYWKKILRRVALTIAPYILPFINSVTPPIISMVKDPLYSVSIVHSTQMGRTSIKNIHSVISFLS